MSCFWPINLIWPQQPQKWLPYCLIKSIFLQGLQYTVKLPAVNWTTYHSILEPFIQRSQYIKIHGCATNRDMLLLTTCFVGHQRWPNSFSLMRVLSQSNHADVTIWWFQHSIYPIMQTNEIYNINIKIITNFLLILTNLFFFFCI